MQRMVRDDHRCVPRRPFGSALAAQRRRAPRPARPVDLLAPPTTPGTVHPNPSIPRRSGTAESGRAPGRCEPHGWVRVVSSCLSSCACRRRSRGPCDAKAGCDDLSVDQVRDGLKFRACDYGVPRHGPFAGRVDARIGQDCGAGVGRDHGGGRRVDSERPELLEGVDRIFAIGQDAPQFIGEATSFSVRDTQAGGERTGFADQDLAHCARQRYDASMVQSTSVGPSGGCRNLL